jgi:hypothetical protein
VSGGVNLPALTLLKKSVASAFNSASFSCDKGFGFLLELMTAIARQTA